MNDKKLYLIEFLRFFASLMVVIWHYQHFFLPYNSNSLIDMNSDYKLISLFPSYNIGILGVYIFFCISGIVFAATYLNKEKISINNFFFRRFARLYPLHLITLVIIAIIQLYNIKIFGKYEIYLLNDLKHFFLNIFFISNWGFQDGESFNGPIWSVSTEILVYIFFFFSINFLNKSKYIFLILILLFIMFIRKTFFDAILLDASFLFFSGVFIFRLYENKKKNFLGLVSFISLLICFKGDFKILTFSIGILSFIMLVENFINLNSKTKKIFSFLGNFTYTSYLIHVPLQLIIIFMINLFNIEIIKFENFKVFIFFILMVYCLSYFIFYYFEKPLNKLIRSKLIKK